MYVLGANTACCLLMFIYTHYTKHAFLEGCGDTAAMVTMGGALYSDATNGVPPIWSCVLVGLHSIT